MVKEDRWDLCESVDGGKTEKVEWSVEEGRYCQGENGNEIKPDGTVKC